LPYLEFEAVLREPATASATPVETTGEKVVNREQLTVEMAGSVTGASISSGTQVM
jgi:hypothetical protein